METLANFLHFGDTPEYPGSTIRIQLEYLHNITMIFNETNAAENFAANRSGGGKMQKERNNDSSPHYSRPFQR